MGHGRHESLLAVQVRGEMGHHPQEPLNQFDMRILESAQQGSGVPVVSGLQHKKRERCGEKGEEGKEQGGGGGNGKRKG